MGQVDVLMVAALPEEFTAARSVALSNETGGPGIARWEDRTLDGGPFLWGEYCTDGGRFFTVALARPIGMGGRPTGQFAATMAERLRPSCLAMPGVCAGNPAAVALGDVVVAEPVYEWDEGKRSVSGFEGDHRQLRMDPDWVRTAQDFDPEGLPSHGAAGDDEAMLWLLERLHFGQEPRDHPARRSYFPAGTWQPRLERFESAGLIRRGPVGGVAITKDGAALVQRRLYDDVDGPERLPFRVTVAPMASGSAVIADPDVWVQLKSMGMRKIAAVEMEAATIATVAYERRLPWLVVKGVMDSADSRKDDRYKRFAAHAAAEVLFALLAGLVVTGEAGPRRGSGPLVAEGSTSPSTVRHDSESASAPHLYGDFIEELSDNQRRILQMVYEYFRRYCVWPTLADIDRPLRREGIDIVTTTRAMPGDLMSAQLGNADPAAHDPMVLTLAGMELCSGAERDVEVFLAMIRWAAAVEDGFDPGRGQVTLPRITSEDVVGQFGLSEDPGAIRRIYAMIRVQPWGFGGGGGDSSSWWYEVRREIQRFARVRSAAEHERARRAWVSESVAPSHTLVSVTGEASPAATQGPVDVVTLLNELARVDPIPDVSARLNGRLYLVVHPLDTSIDALAPISATSAVRDLDDAIRRALDARGGSPFSPDLGSGVWRHCNGGMINERGVSEMETVREDSLLQLKIAESGTITVLCGRATSQARTQWRQIGSTTRSSVHRVLFPSLVLGLVHGTLRLAADLARRYAGYDGRWAVGLRLTGLRKAIAYEYVQSGDEDVVQPYDADTYQRTVTVSTTDLAEGAAATTEQIVAALLRGIAVDRRYLPYTTTDANGTETQNAQR